MRKLSDIDFYESIHTTRGQQFLISNNPEIDLIILGTEENIRMLARYPNWFCDGTFDSAPLGYQLYTVHALLTETVTIPLIFCIAKNKTEVTYNQIFSTLKERDPSLQPDMIMIDFERAALNALTQNFPTAVLQGCYFHFGQAIWRPIQALGFQLRYQCDEEFAVVMKQFRALAFVPENRWLLTNVDIKIEICLLRSQLVDFFITNLEYVFNERNVINLVFNDFLALEKISQVLQY